jgi:peptidoglycan/xylan/chitin deacetylase (PgdA/CDA1 family)
MKRERAKARFEYLKIRHINLQKAIQLVFALFVIISLLVVYQADLSRSVSPVVKNLAFAGLAFLLLSIIITYYEYHGFGNGEGIIRRGPAELVVALTFDDGPSPNFTPLVLDVLKKYDVRATFFLVGKHVEKYPDVARRIVEEGHEIGNHTYNHRDLVPSTSRKLKREIFRAQEAIYRVTGVYPHYFRPPRGIYSEAVRKFVVRHGFKMVLWTVSGVDWAGTPTRVIARRILRFVSPGAIILLHDSGALLKSEGHSRMNTVKALEIVIPKLLEWGYRFVTVSELERICSEKQAVYVPEVIDNYHSSAR